MGSKLILFVLIVVTIAKKLVSVSVFNSSVGILIALFIALCIRFCGYSWEDIF